MSSESSDQYIAPGSAESKEQRCVSAASTNLFGWAVGLIPVTFGAWWLGDKILATLAISGYKAERALIDCNQEYEEREYYRRKREKERKAAAAAAAAEAQASAAKK